MDSTESSVVNSTNSLQNISTSPMPRGRGIGCQYGSPTNLKATSFEEAKLAVMQKHPVFTPDGSYRYSSNDEVCSLAFRCIFFRKKGYDSCKARAILKPSKQAGEFLLLENDAKHIHRKINMMKCVPWL